MAMKIERARLLTALALGLLLLGACDDETKRTLTPPTTPDYLANDSPDNLVANLVMAWEAMDAEGYAALLYDGALLATDSLAYAPFKFYFDRSLDPTLPEVDVYDRELVRIGNMLGGLPGMDGQGNPVPGLKSVNLDLAANGSWTSVTSGEVDGDPCPEDALWRSYSTYILFTLKSSYGGDTNGWLVQDRLIAHCIPVQVGGGVEWRLWKWRDVIDGFVVSGRPALVESSSLSGIKALY
jgi:hypothetical protein